MGRRSGIAWIWSGGPAGGPAEAGGHPASLPGGGRGAPGARPSAILRRLLVLATLSAVPLWATPTLADPIVVRSGEHPTFTRLVLSIPPGTAWTFAPAPGGYALELPQGTEYDLAGAFERIPRDRLARLGAEAGTLRLLVACDCHAVAFLHDDAHLVVDVVDGLPLSGGTVPGPTGPSPVGPGVPVLGQAARVAVTEAAILEGFARAASQGLLDLAPAAELGGVGPAPGASTDAHPAGTAQFGVPAQDAPHDDIGAEVGGGATGHAAEAAAGGDPVDEQRSDGPPLPVEASAARPGLALRTSVDREPLERPPLADAGAVCLPDADLDLDAWAGSGDAAAEMAARLSALTSERDLLREGAVEDLARTYIAFGFGREAMRALSIDGQRSATRDLLSLLARLVDGEGSPPGALEDQDGCLGAVALWRALARGRVSGTDDRERTAMALALRGLPDAVRGHLAVRLSGLLLEADDPGAARAALAMAEGTVTGVGTLAAEARAAVAAAMDGRVRAIDDLAAIAARDARLSPAGLVELVDMTIDEGRSVDDLVLQLRAARFEQRGQPAAPTLLLAEVRALTAASRFGEALDLLEAERGALSEREAQAALTATVTALAQNAADAPFLVAALSRLPDALPEETAGPVATRLRVLGFEPEAAALVADRGDPIGALRRPPPGVTDALDGATTLRGLRGGPDASARPRRPGAGPNAPRSTMPPAPAAATEARDAVTERPGLVATAPLADLQVGPPDVSGPLVPELDVSVVLSAAAPFRVNAAMTLADRQALLDRAALARGRARTLLDDGLPASE